MRQERNKSKPKNRMAQLSEILFSYIRDIPNPVILAGDFNSSGQDLSPTTTGRVIKRTAQNKSNWLSVATTALIPQALVVNTTRAISNITKNFQDPTARSLPIIAPNPQRDMFLMIKNYRFKDGKTFDFRGDKERSINGKSKTLANSNHRDLKGFKTSFRVKRPIGPLIGKYRLDWMFVKSYAKDPVSSTQPYRFAPHFGQTLEELNTSLSQPISDHHPSIVDLPFNEPELR